MNINFINIKALEKKKREKLVSNIKVNCASREINF